MRVLGGLFLALALSACGPKTMEARMRDAEKTADRASNHLDRAEKAAIQLEPKEMESALDDEKDELAKKDIELYPEAQMHFDRYTELSDKLPQVKAAREKRDLDLRLNAARDKIVPRVQAMLEAQEAVVASAPTRAALDAVESKARSVKDAVDDELDLFVKDADFAAWAKSQRNKVDKALEGVARGRKGVAFLEGPVVAWKDGLQFETDSKGKKELGDKETALRESRTKLSACDRTAKPFADDKVTSDTAFAMPQGKPQTPAQLSTACQADLKRVEGVWQKTLAALEKEKAAKKKADDLAEKARLAKEAKEAKIRAAQEAADKKKRAAEEAAEKKRRAAEDKKRAAEEAAAKKKAAALKKSGKSK